MASAVTPPRQLAPNMGQKQVLDGVFIRTGNIIAKTGERVYSGLIQRFGALNFVSDNAGCFGTKPFLVASSSSASTRSTSRCAWRAHILSTSSWRRILQLLLSLGNRTN